MKNSSIRFALAAALAFAGAASAQPARVEAVQYPAWLERGGHSVPLTPGTALQPGDRLRSGDNARVHLKLAEGSTVKLGERAQLVIERAEERGVFRATLGVLAGAFRFTTDALAKDRRRDVSIKVKNVTAGIRGTDLWGKSTDQRDLVCLIEGRIYVGSEGHPTVTLDQPLDFYQRPRDGAPEVSKVDPKQLEVWSRETEIAPDGAAARAGGQWRAVAAVYRGRDEALRLSRRLRAAGYPGEVVARGPAFTVQVAGLAGEAEARSLVASLRAVPGVSMPSVHGPD